MYYILNCGSEWVVTSSDDNELNTGHYNRTRTILFMFIVFFMLGHRHGYRYYL